MVTVVEHEVVHAAIVPEVTKFTPEPDGKPLAVRVIAAGKVVDGLTGLTV